MWKTVKLFKFEKLFLEKLNRNEKNKQIEI
jgi:hypothetical protein